MFYGSHFGDEVEIPTWKTVEFAIFPVIGTIGNDYLY